MAAAFVQFGRGTFIRVEKLCQQHAGRFQRNQTVSVRRFVTMNKTRLRRYNPELRQQTAERIELFSSKAAKVLGILREHYDVNFSGCKRNLVNRSPSNRWNIPSNKRIFQFASLHCRAAEFPNYLQEDPAPRGISRRREFIRANIKIA